MASRNTNSEKLAAAKRKLKEFQLLQRKKDEKENLEYLSSLNTKQTTIIEDGNACNDSALKENDLVLSSSQDDGKNIIIIEEASSFIESDNQEPITVVDNEDYTTTTVNSCSLTLEDADESNKKSSTLADYFTSSNEDETQKHESDSNLCLKFPVNNASLNYNSYFDRIFDENEVLSKSNVEDMRDEECNEKKYNMNMKVQIEIPDDDVNTNCAITTHQLSSHRPLERGLKLDNEAALPSTDDINISGHNMNSIGHGFQQQTSNSTYLQEQLDNLRKMHEELLDESKCLERELVLLRERCNHSETEAKSCLYRLNEAKDAYEKHLTSLMDDLVIARQEKQDKEKEMELLVTKMTSQTEHMCLLEKQLQNLNSHMIVNEDKLREIICKKEEECEKLHLQLNEMQLNKIDNKENGENVRLKEQLNECKEALMQMNVKNAELIENLEEYKRLCTKLEKHNKIETLSVKDAFNVQVMNNNEHVTQQYESVNMEAMMQLQTKFKQVVDKMADLTEEKHQLEHLVLQLQSETETIGEYVTLYQKQRHLLLQREKEKDEFMMEIRREKQQLHDRLSQLNSLLVPLLKNKQHLLSFEDQKFNQQTSAPDQILSILGKLKNYNESMTTSSVNVYHPCPCCSGNLITI